MIGLAALLLQGTQEQPGRAPLMLEIAARGYLSGGRAGSLAGDAAIDRLESYVWVDQTLCSMGAGNNAPPNIPWSGWHFTGSVVSRTADELVVNVEWQRIWEAGRRMNGNQQNRSIRIRAGERVELDRLEPGSAGRCNMVEARLEASVMARAPYLMGVAGGVAAGVPGGVGTVGTVGTVTRGGRGGGVGRGGVATTGTMASSGSGTGTGSGSSGTGTTSATIAVARGGRGGVARGGAAGGVGAGATTATARGGVAAGASRGVATGVQGGGGVQGSGAQAAAAAGVQGGGGRGGRAGVQGQATTATGRPGLILMERGERLSFGERYEAEVWLVHKTPDGKETVQQQTVRFGGASKPFTFPPIEVGPSGSPITIDISGSVQTLSSTGQRYGLTPGYSSRLIAMAGQAGGRGVGRGASAGGGSGSGAATTSSVATPAESAPQLFGVSISRRARRATPFIDTRGATDISLQTPKPDDVLSFELPALQKSTEDLLKGHTFSIRLRVTPVK